ERRPSQLETFHERHRNVSGAEHSYAAMANGMVGSPAASRGGARLVGDVEGVRHSTGNWQRESQEVKWAPRRVLVRSLSPSTLNVSRERRRCRADQEEESYMREASKEPLLDDADGNVRGLDGRDEDISPRSARQRRQQQRRQQQQLENSSNSGNRVRNSNTSAVRGQRSNRGTRAHSSRTRNGNEERATSASREVEGGSSSSYGTRGNREVGRGRYSQDYEDPNAVASHESSHSDDDSDDLSSSESSSSGESTDYSDWTAEQGINLEPPKRTAHRQKKSPSSRSKLRQVRNALATDDEEEEESQVNTSSEQLQEKRISKREKKKNPRYMEKDQAAGQCSASSDGEGPSASQHAPPARQRREVRGRLNNLNESSDSEPGEIPEAFRPPEWLTEIQPKRAPYFPQMGDELMYFMQGHMSYVDAVIKRKLYNIDMKSLPWTKPNSSIKECEYVKIIGIKYEIRPPRLCCLKLAILNPNTNRISTDTFTLKYHDIPDVLDFLVLKQMHDTSAARNWQVGDRFRCIIDDAWWLGTVSRRELPSRECPESLFMTYFVTWDNGETEKLSPWDMEPIGEVAEEHDSGTGIEVSSEELERLRYKWTEEDWPDGRDGGEEGRRIATGMGLVMGLAVAEPFLAPVDLSVYPNYAMIVEYPMDLSTIKSRLENGFYRRLNAVQFDVRYIATNAEKFNQRGSNIVRQARIVTELCLDLIKNPACRDPTARYHEIASSYHSPNASDLDAPGPSAASTSAVVNGNRRCGRPPKMTGQTWQQQCREVLRAVFERGDSMPFRYPVDLEQYPDYDRVVEVPMDLTTVREELSTHSYETPHQFASDVRLIFCNSKSYNTNKKSKIYSMTVRLEAFFEDKMKSVFSSYQAQEKAAKKSSKRGSKSGLTSRRQKSSSNGTKLSASSEPRPLSAAGSSRGHTLRSTVGTGRGACIAGLATSSVVRLRRLTNPYGPSPGSSSLQNGLAEDSNDEGDEKGGLCNEPVEDDEDSPAGDDSFGTRRSKRVAKLKRFLSSDDSDEDYSPVKKRPLEGSVRSKRKVTGTTRSNMPEAGSSSGVGVRSRITVQYQENSDSEQEEYVSPSSLISIPQNNLPHGEAGGASGSSKRVVLKLSFPLDGDQPGTETADSDTASTDDDGDAGGGDADNIAANACNGADDVSNKSVKRKLAIDSSDDQKENVENEGSGASSTDSTIDSLHGSKTNDSESSDSISNRPKKRRKLTVKKLTTPIESESSDSLQQNEGRRSNSHRRNGSLVDKKKIVPNIGRKMPIYKGSLVPGLNKKRQREDSEFECDDNDFQSSDYSEEEVDSKCKKPNKKKKVPSVRKSRRTVLDGDDDLGDEDFVVEDDNIDGRRESDETNSSSSSSSSSSGSSSDDAGRSEESDELLSNNRKSNKKNQLKHSKGIVKSSATSGKKIPLKYKPGKSSRKHLGRGLRGRKRGGLSGSAKRQKSWINDEDDDLLDYESGEEVMDGEQVIGKVYYNSDDDTSDD
ncbi:Bromodomain, partial [Trinorchestia longiramus]